MSQSFCKSPREVLCQERDILGSLPQRWKLERNDVEAVVEVLSKCLLFNALFQITVSGGNDTDVEVSTDGGSNSPNLAILKKLQQLDLGGRRQLLDLVQNGGALIGLLEETSFVDMRSGKSALGVSEELALP